MIELYELAGRDSSLRFSPYCWRVRLALAHKGLEPTTIAWRLHEAPALPGAPHNRTVPVLTDGGDIVAGSTNIAFHLEDRHANGPSLFGGSGGEAHARFIAAWSDTVLAPALAPIAIPYVFGLLHEADRDYFRQTREKRLGMSLEAAMAAAAGRVAGVRGILAPLEATLSGQDFLGGDEPSYADYAVFGNFQWLRCVGAPEIVPPEERVAQWREAMLDLFGGLARRAPTAHAN